ncbi:MAG: hypothetical protein ACI8RD_006331 [Bacillariaceae sp.]|jgi:hypothetical protein
MLFCENTRNIIIIIINAYHISTRSIIYYIAMMRHTGYMEIISTKVGKTRVIVWFAISLSVPLQVVRINSNAQPRFQVIRLSAISTVTLIKRNVTVTILPSNKTFHICYSLLCLQGIFVFIEVVVDVQSSRNKKYKQYLRIDGT